MESWGLCPICKSQRNSKNHTSDCSKQAQKIGTEKVVKPVHALKPDYHANKRGYS